jgi:hypothetical protein
MCFISAGLGNNYINKLKGGVYSVQDTDYIAPSTYLFKNKNLQLSSFFNQN